MQKTIKLLFFLPMLCVGINFHPGHIMGMSTTIAAAAVMDDPVFFSTFAEAFGASSKDLGYNTSYEVDIDGGGKVTLSGRNQRRILYMNTCDENQICTTSHCQNQDHPQLTIQNLTFINGNSKSETESTGGGAVWVRGGRFKIVNCRFFNNVCADTGPDVGGAAVRVFSQYEGEPVYVVNSTFGGRDDLGNVGSNGGGYWYPVYPQISCHNDTQIYVDGVEQ
ncbi:hypothetical protein [uncultured Desulfobacter sp.]|uniref:hypothetical protein n=1 Tax=uncultured Desulfobacter sp. TaxID=240139 RepID=UPI0029F4DC46|nr:hypothetical protein [uncultured Desulfobacter sp.]